VYKTLDTDLLEITGRQSEVIELAMTYGFAGINVDIVDLYKRCGRSDLENATRFLVSSKLKIASFQAPISLDDDDSTFSAKLETLKQLAPIAGKIHAKNAVVTVPSGTDRLPYPEYFDVVRKRIDQIAEVFCSAGVKVALRFDAIASGDDKQFKFVRDVDGLVALTKACVSKNVSVVLDCWNWFLGGGKVSHLDDLGSDRVSLVQVADCKEGVGAAAATAEDRQLASTTGVIPCSDWIKKLGAPELPIAAYGIPASERPTRDTFIGQVQDALDQTLISAGLPTNTRRPETFVAAAASIPYRE
jgi:sugar phosphate isomerase/epimerase